MSSVAPMHSATISALPPAHSPQSSTLGHQSLEGSAEDQMAALLLASKFGQSSSSNNICNALISNKIIDLISAAPDYAMAAECNSLVNQRNTVDYCYRDDSRIPFPPSSSVLSVTMVGHNNVQAFAKLEACDGHTGESYFLRTLRVTLGRKTGCPDIDIDLGDERNISRKHVSIEYNFSRRLFECCVLGKNSITVDSVCIEKGVTVPLTHKSKLQVGSHAFWFMLPEITNTANNTTINNHITHSLRESSSKHNITSSKNNSISFQRLRRANSIAVSSPPPSSSCSPPPIVPSSSDIDFDIDDIDSSPEDSNLQNLSRFSNSTNHNTNHTIPVKPQGDENDPSSWCGMDGKPPFSYPELIAHAIRSYADNRMTLKQIYKYLMTNYPFFRQRTKAWQNSIRHNLSLNKQFVKVRRGPQEPGKGYYWTLDPALEQSSQGSRYKSRAIKLYRTKSAPYPSNASVSCSPPPTVPTPPPPSLVVTNHSNSLPSPIIPPSTASIPTTTTIITQSIPTTTTSDDTTTTLPSLTVTTPVSLGSFTSPHPLNRLPSNHSYQPTQSFPHCPPPLITRTSMGTVLVNDVSNLSLVAQHHRHQPPPSLHYFHHPHQRSSAPTPVTFRFMPHKSQTSTRLSFSSSSSSPPPVTTTTTTTVTGRSISPHLLHSQHTHSTTHDTVKPTYHHSPSVDSTTQIDNLSMTLSTTPSHLSRIHSSTDMSNVPVSIV